jgi:ribosomal protein S18 acetylase RimI-like enzyme
VPFTIRDYRESDFQTLWEIDQSCFDAEIAYSQQELRAYLRYPRAFALVATGVVGTAEAEDDQIAGFIVAAIRGRNIGHVITLDVRAEARRQHVGSTLLEHAEVKLRSSRCTCVRLETAVDNLSALTFYKRSGYTVIKTIPHYYSNGLDALLLEKHLLSPPGAANVLT